MCRMIGNKVHSPQSKFRLRFLQSETNKSSDYLQKVAVFLVWSSLCSSIDSVYLLSIVLRGVALHLMSIIWCKLLTFKCKMMMHVPFWDSLLSGARYANTVYGTAEWTSFLKSAIHTANSKHKEWHSIFENEVLVSKKRYLPFGEGKKTHRLFKSECWHWKQAQLLSSDSSQDFCFERDFGGSSSAIVGWISWHKVFQDAFKVLNYMTSWVIWSVNMMLHKKSQETYLTTCICQYSTFRKMWCRDRGQVVTVSLKQDITAVAKKVHILHICYSKKYLKNRYINHWYSSRLVLIFHLL